ncbi:hypothetical protein EIP86_003507 [Pleurotus ostreatoroseus]|nr:hypothetical protein EIP86_003507 [Pleurotus ostreatoroseus]
MASRISPNRRRSIAVLNQGGGSSHASRRRRAYSIAPGEKLSPAARARNLVPRKSILKGALPRPSLGQENSGTAGDSTDVTQSMDLTEVQHTMSRKSLARRVSFASHAHVRLFEVQDPNASSSADQSPSPSSQEVADSDEEAEDDHEAQEIPAQTRRRSSYRRRSSTAFSEFGEQSMEMDEGDSAMDPEDFLERGDEPYDENEDEDEDYEGGNDMDMTEVIPREFLRKRSLSLGGPSQSFTPRRRSSVALATSSSAHSENQVHPRTSTQPVSQQQPATRSQESIYPSLQLEDILNLPPDEQDDSHKPDRAQEDVTSSTMQFGTEDMTESSGGDNTQPMEFTIPVVRPPPPPSKEWLQLRAMTHAGSEPYEPPPEEPSDDPEANAIVSFDQDRNETPMELTDALSRLQKARSSLVMPPNPDEEIEDYQVADGANEFPDDTFTSTEDSFDNGFDGDRTINVTKLRQSLGAASRRDESMDITGIYAPDSSQSHSQTTQNAPDNTSPPTVQTSDPTTERPPVFSFANRSQSSVLSQPTKAPTTAAAPVFSLPVPSSASSVFSAPSRPSQIPAPPPPKSPSRATPTVPKPFTFSLDSRLGSPSKGKEPARSVAASSPSKLPVFRGTAAFAGPTVPKSPKKRAAPASDVGDDRDQPSPAKKQAVGKLSPMKKAAFERPSAPAPTSATRRTSGVRRPSGYFAQRKSLGGGTLTATSSLPNVGSNSPERTPARSRLQQRASFGASPAENSAPLYPDLSRIEASVPSTPKAPAELYPDVAAIVQEHPPTPTSQAHVPPKGAETNSSLSPDRQGAIQAEMATSQVGTSMPGGIPPSPPSSSVPASSGKAPAPSVPPSQEPLPRPASPIHIFPPKAQETTITAEIDVTVEPSAQISGFSAEDVDQEEQMVDDGDMELTEQWRDGLDEADDMYAGEEPTISVEQFFQMTGIRFMDELTAPRRSTIHPGQLRQNRRRSLTSSHSEEAEPVPLADFMIAMGVEVPQLELYSILASELTAWIEESKKICRQAEEDAIKMTPALFREFADADESEKADLVHQLKLIKAHNIGMAKSQWYDWKSQWVGQLQNSAAEAFANLESDAKVLEDIINQAQDMLPSLRAEYEQAARELQQEEADIAELQNSDKDYLNELKVSIAEQEVELQAFKSSVTEAEAKLKRLDEKLADIEAQKQENTTAITRAEQIIHIQTESTSSEVFRLRDELEALQDLHLWRSLKLQSSLIEFEYASRFLVSIPCVKYKPVAAKLTITRTKGSKLKERDSFPELTRLMMDGGRHSIASPSNELDLRKVYNLILSLTTVNYGRYSLQIVQRLSDFWSSCAQIRSQLTFLKIKYPLSVKLIPVENSAPSLRVTATVLFLPLKSKANISFTFDSQTYMRWPLTITSLKTDVEVAYGSIE